MGGDYTDKSKFRDFGDCVRDGGVKPRPKGDMTAINRELEEAAGDLSSAKRSLDSGDYKWSVNQSYASMFASTRAVLISRGYIEDNNHICLYFFLKRLVDRGELESHFASDFKSAKSLREQSTYHSNYSRDDAGKLIVQAEEFVGRMKALTSISI